METPSLAALGLIIGACVATVEGLVEILTSIRDKSGVWNSKLVYTVACGVLVAILIPGFDLFKVSGIAVVPPFAGRILTGILTGRGAKFFHDFLSIVEAYKTNLKARALPAMNEPETNSNTNPPSSPALDANSKTDSASTLTPPTQF